MKTTALFLIATLALTFGGCAVQNNYPSTPGVSRLAGSSHSSIRGTSPSCQNGRCEVITASPTVYNNSNKVNITLMDLHLDRGGFQSCEQPQYGPRCPQPQFQPPFQHCPQGGGNLNGPMFRCGTCGRWFSISQQREHHLHCGRRGVRPYSGQPYQGQQYGGSPNFFQTMMEAEARRYGQHYIR